MSTRTLARWLVAGALVATRSGCHDGKPHTEPTGSPSPPTQREVAERVDDANRGPEIDLSGVPEDCLVVRERSDGSLEFDVDGARPECRRGDDSR